MVRFKIVKLQHIFLENDGKQKKFDVAMNEIKFT
jgi:hypothetical protein